MKQHERAELLGCAQHVATALNEPPARVPVEGYYTEDSALRKYFRLMRTLQRVPLGRAVEVQAIPEFRRLLAVASSPIFGSPVREYLLPSGRDPLSVALWTMDMDQWTVPSLTAEAAKVAQETDDISLVGLAARVKDSVGLAALRESVVLYAERVVTGLPPQREFLWQVDNELAKHAQRFVDTFNALFRDKLPPPIHQYAEVYWHAHARARILGRCVRLGETDTPPVRYYHWGICNASAGQLAAQEFWHHEIWTTAQYRQALQRDGGCPEL